MLGLIFTCILGFLLRLIGIVKPEGLWNDEYVSWSIASTSFSDGFVPAMLSQCHMPFYYLYLKMCMFFGGNGDTFLRVTSLIPGVLSIIVMYFVGLRYNRKCAIFAALITSLSSFLIYYSQEVRLYSLLFLFSALSLLYLLKYLGNRTLTNLGGLLLFDFLIMFTHTIGFVFVFFELLVLSFLIFQEEKKRVAVFWTISTVLFLILLPNIYHIISGKSFAQWWGVFSISKIGFLFTDYFSPVLTNLVNAPDKFLYNTHIMFLFFLLVPTLMALVFTGKAVWKNKQNSALFLIGCLVVLVMVITAKSGKLVFITKYSVEIYPILIFLAAYGAASFTTKYLGNILMTAFCVINAWYLLFSPTSAPKMPRPEGHKLVADLISHAEPKKDDIILLQYYDKDRFNKYFDFSDYRTLSVNKGNFHEYLAENGVYSEIYKDGKTIYEPVFKNSGKGYIDYKLQKEVVDELKDGQSVIVIVNDSVAFYNNEIMKKIVSDSYVYKKIPLLFLVFSYVSNHTVDTLSESLKIARAEKIGTWSLIKFTKLNK